MLSAKDLRRSRRGFKPSVTSRCPIRHASLTAVLMGKQVAGRFNYTGQTVSSAPPSVCTGPDLVLVKKPKLFLLTGANQSSSCSSGPGDAAIELKASKSVRR
ncbi:unnamed protein product [Pleuronectes platessa]|uniref:Uncharacterized protein n=1 Tax=Pleuronectes platessa TaxID=8262 RepID=A0A9N7Z2L7_PLEPL|nr:unnamed protein product [Pleuronectes platessa]